MANPYKELQNLIIRNTNRRKRGVVIKVTDSELFVSVGARTRRIPRAGDSTKYKNGDTVLLQGDILMGKTGSRSGVKTFAV